METKDKTTSQCHWEACSPLRTPPPPVFEEAPIRPFDLSLPSWVSFSGILVVLLKAHGERLCAFLDDLYVTSNPERTVDCHQILGEELWHHAKIRLHHGKMGEQPNSYGRTWFEEHSQIEACCVLGELGLCHQDDRRQAP